MSTANETTDATITTAKPSAKTYGSADNPLVAEFAQRINEAWHKSVSAILATAAVCAEARTAFAGKRKAMTALKKRLAFDKATFSKLATIGSNPTLYEEAVSKLLPCAYTAMYEVARLTAEKIRDGIKAEKITPNAKGAAIKSWSQGTAASKSPAKLVKVTLTAKYNSESDQQIAAALKTIGDQFGLSFKWPVKATPEPAAAVVEKQIY